MPGVVRKGDVNSAGGVAKSGNPDFIVDGRPIVTIGTPVSKHAPCPDNPKHCSASTRGGSKIFSVDNKPVNLVGDKDSCGHSRVTGSQNFIIGE